jgi:hypothetical protein
MSLVATVASGSPGQAWPNATANAEQPPYLLLKPGGPTVSHAFIVNQIPVVLKATGMLDEVVDVEFVEGLAAGDQLEPYSPNGVALQLTPQFRMLVLPIPGRYRVRTLDTSGTMRVMYQELTPAAISLVGPLTRFD